ncbi:MAG TPA: secondary thiamine-phosphate synthase enzyme YjbQ [bacterium]|jgi:secondary thiamine-phosphate synthase enzyme
MITLNVNTNSRFEFVDITVQVRNAIREYGWKDGILTVFNPHTTAAITINENADPSVPSDILTHLQKMIPQGQKYFRHMEHNSDSHIMSSLVGTSEQVIVHSGDLILGTWQGIFYCEFDGPRQRKVYLHFRSD